MTLKQVKFKQRVSTGPTVKWKLLWFNAIFWRVMELIRKLRYDYLSRKNFALHHSCPRFLGQVISVLLEVNYGRVYPLCLSRLPMQYTIVQPDPTWSGVMQSITARLNSFLHQTNNNLCYYRGRESNRAPRVGVHK